MRQEEKMTTGWIKIEDDIEINHLGFNTGDGRQWRITFTDNPIHLKAGESVTADFGATERPRPKFFKGNPFTIPDRYFWVGLILPNMEVELTIWRTNGKQSQKFRYGRLEEVK